MALALLMRKYNFCNMSKIVVFLKNWLLPVAMVSGAVLYFIFSRISFMAPFRPFVLEFVNGILPFVIFATLFFTFCKISIKEMKPRRWHIILLLSQTILCVVCVLIIKLFFKEGDFNELLAQGVLACLLSPTATAAAVLTGKLGGSSASLTSYTLESNVLSAILITILCPMVHPIQGLDLFLAFMTVLYRVFILLILPFISAMIIKYLLPGLHARLVAIKDAAFYLWGFTLMLITGLTLRVVALNASDYRLEKALVIAAAIVCALKFAFGKFIGCLYSKEDRISAGQAFGQKNTSFTIWMALTFLNPISAVAPGSYVIWQNIVNSFQLWKKRKAQEV